MKETTKIKADALAKAALQATARALHTAQLSHDAYAIAEADTTRSDVIAGLRDKLLDAYASIPAEDRKLIDACKATITSDELIDLLAMCVKG